MVTVLTQDAPVTEAPAADAPAADAAPATDAAADAAPATDDAADAGAATDDAAATDAAADAGDEAATASPPGDGEDTAAGADGGDADAGKAEGGDDSAAKAEEGDADAGKTEEDGDDSKAEEKKFLHEGFLNKKGGGKSFLGRRNWKVCGCFAVYSAWPCPSRNLDDAPQKRYVVITNDYCLSYYKSATNTSKPLKGLVMPLAGFTIDENADDKVCFTIEPPEGAKVCGRMRVAGTGTGSCAHLWSPPVQKNVREIQFKANNEEDKARWVAAFKEHLAAAGPFVPGSDDEGGDAAGDDDDSDE